MVSLENKGFIMLNKKEKSKKLDETFKRKILKHMKKEGYILPHIKAVEELLNNNVEMLENFPSLTVL